MHYMGSWHLLAWCGKRRALRDFSLARIQSIQKANASIALPAALPPIREITRRHFGIMQGEQTIGVTLRFSTKIAPLIAEQIWHPEQRTDMENDGSLLMQFPVADFRELTRIILSHGAEVEVVEPQELKLTVMKEIQRMMQKYDW